MKVYFAWDDEEGREKRAWENKPYRVLAKALNNIISEECGADASNAFRNEVLPRIAAAQLWIVPRVEVGKFGGQIQTALTAEEQVHARATGTMKRTQWVSAWVDKEDLVSELNPDPPTQASMPPLAELLAAKRVVQEGTPNIPLLTGTSRRYPGSIVCDPDNISKHFVQRRVTRFLVEEGVIRRQT